MQGGNVMGGFAGNNNGGPMMMGSSSSSAHNPNPTINNNNTLFDYQRHMSSILMPQDSNNNINRATFTGSFLMDNTTTTPNNDSPSSSASVKANLMAHPQYNRLLAAYINCYKIGAPQEVVARLEEAYVNGRVAGSSAASSSIAKDPALDQFMEAYIEMLTKYEQELSKPFKDAINFFSMVEYQLKALTGVDASACPDAMDGDSSSEEEVYLNKGMGMADSGAEDRKLKGQLLHKYGGYLGNLKQELLMKKRKKGSLPGEAKQHLMEWWIKNYKWPYPSEAEKVALEKATNLDQKQINNWFINQRKRHWKHSDEMQMDAAAAGHHPYMDNVYGNPFPMDF